MTSLSRPTRLPRAVVFDLDGTLVDSAADIASALAATLEGEGLEPFSIDAVKAMVGGGSRRLIERALAALGESPPAARIDRLTETFERHYLEVPCRVSRVYPGGVELLNALAQRGIGLGICTNKSAHVTDRLLAALGLDRYFGAVVAGSHSVPKKPHPAMLLAVLSRLGASPAESLMVGDSDADVDTARAAGCRVALVSFGYGGENALALRPDVCVDDLASILSALPRLFGNPSGA